MTGPRSARGRIDYTASNSTAVAKGSAGDTAVGRLLIEAGWSQVADLARTFPGADLIAFCACGEKHELWGEVKTYGIGKIKDESWGHMQDRAIAVAYRQAASFLLFTYQRANGRPKKGQGKQWWIAEYPDWKENQRPLLSDYERIRPPCALSPTLVSEGGYQRGVSKTRSRTALSRAESGPPGQCGKEHIHMTPESARDCPKAPPASREEE